MALIDYLVGGEKLDAAKMNTLFAEADRKISLALDGKSMVFWTKYSPDISPYAFQYFAPFFSQRENRFFFYEGDHFFIPRIFQSYLFPEGGAEPGFWNYDQQPFTDAAAATAQSTASGRAPYVDHARKIVVLADVDQSYFDLIGRPNTSSGGNPKGLFFVNSLAICTKMVTNPETEVEEPYRILTEHDIGGQPGRYILERPLDYEVAELIYEGTGFETVEFPAVTYNKHRCYRIHNLNDYEMEFKFMDDEDAELFSLTIPARGSKCVRRDTPTTGYELGYNHFFKVKTGDPMAYSGFIRDPSAGDYQINEYRDEPNNVVNPAIIQKWIVSMARQSGVAGETGTERPMGCGAKVVLDETLFWDASTIYCNPDYPPATTPENKDWKKKLFPALPGKTWFKPIADETKIGDLLYHTGKLMYFGAPTEAYPDGDFYNKVNLNFNGFDTIVADFAAAGFAVTETGLALDDGTWTGGYTLIKSPDDEPQDRHLISVSTNLLVRTGGVASPVGFDPGLTIYPIFPTNPVSHFTTSDQVQQLTNFGGFRYNLLNYDQDGHNITAFVYDEDDSTTEQADTKYWVRATGLLKPIPLTTTVEDIKNVSLFVYRSLVAVDDIGDFTKDQIEHTNALRGDGLRLTGFGLILSYTKTITLESPLTAFWSDYSVHGFLECGGENMVEKTSLALDAMFGPSSKTNSWPEYLLAHEEQYRNLLQTPRSERMYCRPVFRSKSAASVFYPADVVPITVEQSPWIRSYQDSGEDSKVKPFNVGKSSGFAMLGASNVVEDIVAEVFNGAHYELQPGDDVHPRRIVEIIFGTRDDVRLPIIRRTPITIEHYNNLASLVNAIVRYRPLHFFDFFYDLTPPDSYTGFLQGWRPKEQWPDDCFTSGVLKAKFSELGIEASGYDDLPSIYRDFYVATRDYVHACAIDMGYTSGDPADAFTQLFLSKYGLFFQPPFTNLDDTPYGTEPVYPWITIADMQDAAERSGFKFYWQRATVPANFTFGFGTTGSLLGTFPIEGVLSGEVEIHNYFAFEHDTNEHASAGLWVKDVGANPKVKPEYDPFGQWDGGGLADNNPRHWFGGDVWAFSFCYDWPGSELAPPFTPFYNTAIQLKKYLPTQPSFDNDYWVTVLFTVYADHSDGAAIGTPLATVEPGSGRTITQYYGHDAPSDPIYFYESGDAAPPTVIPADDGGVQVRVLDVGENVITAINPKESIQFFMENMSTP